MQSRTIVAESILKVLGTRQGDLSVQDIIESIDLDQAKDPMEIRRAIWELAADSKAEITWDWKVRRPSSSPAELTVGAAR